MGPATIWAKSQAAAMMHVRVSSISWQKVPREYDPAWPAIQRLQYLEQSLCASAAGAKIKKKNIDGKCRLKRKKTETLSSLVWIFGLSVLITYVPHIHALHSCLMVIGLGWYAWNPLASQEETAPADGQTKGLRLTKTGSSEVVSNEWQRLLDHGRWTNAFCNVYTSCMASGVRLPIVLHHVVGWKGPIRRQGSERTLLYPPNVWLGEVEPLVCNVLTLSTRRPQALVPEVCEGLLMFAHCPCASSP
jgi:hypothetical protein